ncbi:hypothetical protein FRC15_004459 [Serendipita sp. 397]|nr:hypothetical protein FRC15_004459 [Serendipita sp. 397]
MQRRRQHANEKSSMKQDHFNGGLVEKIFRNEVDPTKRDLVESENSTALSSQIVGATQQVMAIVRGSVIGVVTNIGSPPQNISFPVLTPYQRNVATTDMPLGVTASFLSNTRKVDVLLSSFPVSISGALASAAIPLLRCSGSRVVPLMVVHVFSGMGLFFSS